jgi:Rod binding domain-containing protein
MVSVALSVVPSEARMANSEEPRVSSPRLVHAAHEFEGQMMRELLKPMTGGNSLAGEDGDEAAGAGSGGVLSEFASEALGQALSERGGFGIADRIVKELSKSESRQTDAKVTGNLREDILMRSPE